MNTTTQSRQSKIASDLVDSVNTGYLDLADAIVVAMVQDGIPYELATKARISMALAYKISGSKPKI